MFRRPVVHRFFSGLFGSAAKAAPAATGVADAGAAASSSSSSSAPPPPKKGKYATGVDMINDSDWQPGKYKPDGAAPADAADPAHFAAALPGDRQALSKAARAAGAQQAQPDDSGALAKAAAPAQPPSAATGWMVGAEWASIGDEFKGVDSGKFLKRVPDGFLTPRAAMDVQPAEALLSDFLAVINETYKDVDVRDPTTVAKRLEVGETSKTPTWLTRGGQVRAVGEFVSGHLAHQVSLPVWQNIFDLKYMEMDLMYWLYVIHVHIVCRRATSVRIDTWSRRREVMEELVLTMYASWRHTSEEVMGRPPLAKIRNYIKEMYFVTGVNLEEALMHDGPGGDLMLLGVLVKFCPLPRPEDIPLYSYYTLVHYVRFHIALFDRISDEEFSRGNFHFFSPDDPAVFKKYEDCAFDEVIREWSAAGAEGRTPRGENIGAAAAAAAAAAGRGGAAGATEKAEPAAADSGDSARPST
jgi:hypothetical protein